MKLLEELFAQGFLSEASTNALKAEAGKSGKPEEEIILSKNIDFFMTTLNGYN